MQTYLKPKLLYGFETNVLRVQNGTKLGAVANTAKAMALVFLILEGIDPESVGYRHGDVYLDFAVALMATDCLVVCEQNISRWLKHFQADASKISGSVVAAMG